MAAPWREILIARSASPHVGVGTDGAGTCQSAAFANRARCDHRLRDGVIRAFPMPCAPRGRQARRLRYNGRASRLTLAVGTRSLEAPLYAGAHLTIECAMAWTGRGLGRVPPSR